MGLKKIAKKLAGCALCGTLLVGTMGMTSFASSGSISGSCFNNSASASLLNSIGSTRYCNVVIKQSANSQSYNDSIASNGGVVSSGNTISTSGVLTKTHARGYGIIYTSKAPQSTIAWTDYTQLR